MANKIILKKSSVATKAPVAGDLDFGELAINYTDSKLYFKKADGSIDAFVSGAASAPVTSVGGNIGAITDAQLLTSIKNVDGTGSGLDADFLDGNHASAFYLSSNPSGYTSNTGTVTSVGATAPIVSSGGTTPSLSIAAATASVNGYMSAAYASKLDGIAAGATNVTNTNQLTNGAGYITSANSISGNAATATYATSAGTASNGGVTSVNGATGAVTVVTGAFPSGTRLPFAQASAPTGWTQDTSDDANNRMLRVVNTAGNGVGGSSSPILNNVVPSHTHGFSTGTQSANHNHGISDPTHRHDIRLHWTSASAPGQISGRENSFAATRVSEYAGTGISTGTNSVSHTHSGTTDNGSSQTNWTPRYIDMIICTKG